MARTAPNSTPRSASSTGREPRTRERSSPGRWRDSEGSRPAIAVASHRPGSAPSRAPRPRIEPLRAALVARIRGEIKAGTYDVNARLPLALERLLQDLASE